MNTVTKDKDRFFAFSNKASVLTLDIMDCIGSDMFGEGITASAVSDAITTSGDFDGITLNINSPGGSLFEGVAIYNTLKASGKPVTVNVIGMAASAASLVAMAGDTVTMQLGTQMMIHRAMAGCVGFSDDMRKMADTLDSVTASAADLYVAKTGMSKDKILELMAAETWMSPEEAVEKGFANNVSKQAKAIKNTFDLSMFKNTPVELKVQTKEVDGEALTAEDYIWVGNPHDVSTWALPWHFSTDEKTKSHLRDALARFDQEEKIPSSEKAEAHAKLVRLCKEHGITVSEPTNSVEDFDMLSILRKQIEIARSR